jgi:hypothetical protein
LFYLTGLKRNVKKKAPLLVYFQKPETLAGADARDRGKTDGKRCPLVDYFAIKKRGLVEHRRCE